MNSWVYPATEEGDDDHKFLRYGHVERGIRFIEITSAVHIYIYVAVRCGNEPEVRYPIRIVTIDEISGVGSEPASSVESYLMIYLIAATTYQLQFSRLMCNIINGYSTVNSFLQLAANSRSNFTLTESSSFKDNHSYLLRYQSSI